MKLIHFSAKPVQSVYAVEQPASERGRFAPKPKGLWVSDEDAFGWREWCTAEDFGTERLEHAHRVELAEDARLLVIRDATGIDDLTRLYGTPEPGSYYVDWPAVASRFQGILITPYIGERRLSMHASWYYPWDCASGCIWDPAAIASITPCELEPMEADS